MAGALGPWALGFEGDGEGDDDRSAQSCLYRSRPRGVRSRASLGDLGGHCCSIPGARGGSVVEYEEWSHRGYGSELIAGEDSKVKTHV